MASSDFDDIFGDLKEDQQFSASLATGSGADLDDASIFGDASSAVMNMKAATTSKPPAASSGGGEDEFLSWLDDAPPPSPVTALPSATPTDPIAKSNSGSLPAVAATPPPRPPAMDTIDLGGDDDDDFLSTTRADSLHDEPLDSPANSAAVNPMPATIPVHVAPPPAPVATSPTTMTTTTILLDDDDDDDLEKIVQQASANARKAGSREGSRSSLHIKSQSQSHRVSAQYDTATLVQQANASGVVATPAARLAMWHHALCGGGTETTTTKDSISMYAVQTTPLDLPNQSALRKDVETMSSTIFASALHAESLSDPRGGHDDDDGARLLFIDNAEILVTYLCKKLRLAEYPRGLAFAFGPAIAVGGNDPLRLDLLETIQAACTKLLPHLARQVSPRRVAAARRALLKWLLLYHAPSVAFHLDQHFHQWNASSTDDDNNNTATIPDAWLSSLWESDGYREGFDFLVHVWDCCALLDVAKAFPSVTVCFVVVYLIRQAEKKLLRMEGDQLRHCLAETLLGVLKDKAAPPLLLGVRKLVEATPPSLCEQLRDAGLVDDMDADVAATAEDAGARAKPFSLLAASTNGVLQVGSAVGSAVNTMVIDMPTKLLTTIVPIKFSLPGSSSSSSSSSAKDPAVNEAFFTQLMREASPASCVCVTLAARDVVPHVFRSFQAAPSSGDAIRYFVVDCRAADETAQGQIPTAFHFDPDAVTDPAVLDTVLATLTPLQDSVHLVVMGHGYGHIADSLRQLLAAQPPGSVSGDPPFFLQDAFLESFARDLSRVHAAVLFLAKRGFSHVSVLDGGYAAAHTELLRSGAEGFSVADLIDHDAPKCALCHHRRPSVVSSAGSLAARTDSQRRHSIADGRASPPASRGSSSAALAPQQPGPKLSGSSSGELDAKALFDAHTMSPSSATGATYFSSFAGALKTSGGKAMGMMNPASSMVGGGSKWLMGMKTSSSNPSSPTPAGDGAAGNRSPLASGGMANLSKLKNSLSQIGSESLDMLKKAEQAAAKSSQLKGMFGAMSASNLKAGSASPAGSPAATPTSGSGSLPRAASFQRAEEEVFTIDDDDEEEQDDFVGGSGGGGSGRGSSRTSSSSSMTGHRTESFAGSPTEAGGMPSTVVLHTVEKGKVKELTKGMRVSRTQMLPFVESPFFSAYKKKQPAAPTGATAAPGRASMLPRRLVVAENHVVVLKAERNMDDVYCVKSCHHLSHLGRMTCLKKNALMVTLYYKWKAPHSGEILEKKNAYEVQQRDEFIKVIKTAMEKM